MHGIVETLRKQASEAAKLLANAPPVVEAGRVGPPIIGPPAGRKRITKVDEGQGQGWTAAELDRAMDDLRQRLEADPSLKVSLTWAIFREEGP